MGWRRESIRSRSQHENVCVFRFQTLTIQVIIQQLPRFSINSTFGVGYGIGGVQGIAYRDKVIIADATAIDQFIGAANKTTGFDLVKPFDGIRTFLHQFFSFSLFLFSPFF